MEDAQLPRDGQQSTLSVEGNRVWGYIGMLQDLDNVKIIVIFCNTVKRDASFIGNILEYAWKDFAFNDSSTYA